MEERAVLGDRNFPGSMQGETFGQRLYLLNSGFFWQKERIGIRAGR